MRLRTTRPNVNVVVEAIHDSKVLASQMVRAHGGRASLVFDGNDKFENDVAIVAYSFGIEAGGDDYGPSGVGIHTVLFPKDSELKVAIKPEKTTYRPGDEATVDFRVSTAQGELKKSALGLVIIDKALEERARIDDEFGVA